MARLSKLQKKRELKKKVSRVLGISLVAFYFLFFMYMVYEIGMMISDIRVFVAAIFSMQSGASF